MFEAMIKRGTLMTIITLIICVLGILAALNIPVQMIPDLAGGYTAGCRKRDTRRTGRTSQKRSVITAHCLYGFIW